MVSHNTLINEERFADQETGTGFTLMREAIRDSFLRSRCSLRSE
jgi:hypothetical protein